MKDTKVAKEVFKWYNYPVKKYMSYLWLIMAIIGCSSLLYVIVTYPPYYHEGIIPDREPTPTYIPVLLNPYTIYDLVNEYRTSKGLSKLKWNPIMCNFTKQRLTEIHTDWSHNGFHRMINSQHPYAYVNAGENLGEGFDNEGFQVDGWLASFEHRKNILDPNYTDTCIALDAQFAVQEFASF